MPIVSAAGHTVWEDEGCRPGWSWCWVRARQCTYSLRTGWWVYCVRETGIPDSLAHQGWTRLSIRIRTVISLLGSAVLCLAVVHPIVPLWTSRLVFSFVLGSTHSLLSQLSFHLLPLFITLLPIIHQYLRWNSTNLHHYYYSILLINQIICYILLYLLIYSYFLTILFTIISYQLLLFLQSIFYLDFLKFLTLYFKYYFHYFITFNHYFLALLY